MALDSTTSLSVAELVFYPVFFPITFYLLAKHGRRGLLAYVYLILFEILRMVAAGLQISAHDAGKTSTTGAILDAVGLSPLLLAFSGFVYESNCYYRDQRQRQRQSLIQEAFIHLGAYTGIALAAVGASNLIKHDATPSDIKSAHHLQETGSCLLLLTWVGLTYLCVRLCRNIVGSGPSSRSRASLLVLTLLGACTMVGVRAVYSVVYAFDHSASVSPITGIFVFKFIFVFLVQIIAVMLLLAVGLLTRNIFFEHQREDWHPVRTAGSRDGEGGGSSMPLTAPK
jgi:hypothetical protein